MNDTEVCMLGLGMCRERTLVRNPESGIPVCQTDKYDPEIILMQWKKVSSRTLKTTDM